MIFLETEQIHNAISSKLTTAQNNITICVAWFTGKSFSDVLVDRLKKVKVNILISDHEFNHKSSHFNLLLKYQNCKLYILSTFEKRFMHNKFCVIDNTWVITGSYNWSDKAESNYENILILQNSDIAKSYLEYFEYLRLKSLPVSDFKAYVRRFITGTELQSDEFETNLIAKRFEKEVLDNLNKSKRYITVDFDKIQDNIQLYSGVGAARIYCNEPKIQSGLRQLKEKGHLELSFEWMVLQPDYSTLFSSATKTSAKRKLTACNYVFPEYMQ